MNSTASRTWSFPSRKGSSGDTAGAEWPTHDQQYAVLFEKLQMFRRSVASDGSDDADRGDLYEFLTDWLLHLLAEP